MFNIRALEDHDIPLIVAAFSQIGWNKPASLFQEYLNEQRASERFVWVAFNQDKFLGYVTLKLHSEYLPFQEDNIPEIKDLNVLPIYRKQGIGSALIQKAEDKALAFGKWVGIGVGLTADYGEAQKMYVKRGYVPDGRGVTYTYKTVEWDCDYKVNDDLVLWFIKGFASESNIKPENNL